eukprot:g33762.t1
MAHSFFRSYSSPSPQLFLQYINDIVGAASLSHPELEKFINFTSKFHPAVSFTWSISDSSLPFLHISVSISGNRQATNIPYKPTDFHVFRMDHSLWDTLVHMPLVNASWGSEFWKGGLLQCPSEAQHKLEEQHFIFRLGILHSSLTIPTTISSFRAVSHLSLDTSASLNVIKREELIIDFRKKGGGRAPICINGTEVERVDSIKVLRVTPTNKLSWTFHVDVMIKKAQRCLFFLRRPRRFG